MMFKLIMGGIIGGVIAFICSFISWGVLSWHEVTINKFTDQDCVAQVIQENAHVDGVYIAPFESFSPEKGQEFKKQEMQLRGKPFIYAQVKTQGIDLCRPSYYIYSFLNQCVGAMLIGFLLKKMVKSTYGERLFCVIIMGLMVGFLGLVPSWIWFGAGYSYTLMMMLETLIQWLFAGLFLAGFIKPPRSNSEGLTV